MTQDAKTGHDIAKGKKNSIALTEGPSRAAARSFLRGVGFSNEDLHKPIIGIANTWTEIGTCNFHFAKGPSRKCESFYARKYGEGI